MISVVGGWGAKGQRERVRVWLTVRGKDKAR